jgi:hypothetical protein
MRALCEEPCVAELIRFFMAPEDEESLMRFLERFELDVYPSRVPPDWREFKASAETLPRFPEGDAYLAASQIGPVIVDKVKRGPDKGAWRVDDERSPVMYFQRCVRNEEGELLSGRLWAELDITEHSGRRTPAPDRFRALFQEVERWMKKSFRKSQPAGYLIGPKVARLVKEGLVLRVREHRGGTVTVY